VTYRMGGAERYPPIGDYGLISDCRAAGLVSRDGSIDWLCFPRVDSPSTFGALLDARSGGRFRIRPTGPFEAHSAMPNKRPHLVPPLGEIARARVDRSARWWRNLASRCTYDGPYREAVLRSALVLKLMAYAPSGAVLAAPTTSLPEQLGVSATGTTATAGCAMRPSPCGRYSRSAITKKPRLSASGCLTLRA
jgi:GH15 family glucan-1,4-alpha-glucosidase